jgi:muconolactone delta-isomerase
VTVTVCLTVASPQEMDASSLRRQKRKSAASQGLNVKVKVKVWRYLEKIFKNKLISEKEEYTTDVNHLVR